MSITVLRSAVYLAQGVPVGEPVQSSRKVLHQLAGYFADAGALARMDPQTLLYEVSYWEPVAAGTEGGLFFGISKLQPGTVGEEFFFTKGHSHARAQASEFYWGIAGKGLLLCMDAQRECSATLVEPGSLHYIPGFTSHRLVNIGTVPLEVGACWPADAGHNYQGIATQGFSLRVLAGPNGEAQIIKV